MALQNHGEKGEEWRISVVLEGDQSRGHRENRLMVAFRNLITKAKRGWRTWEMQDMAFGMVSSSFPTAGGPSHTWDISDQYAARRLPSTICHRLQGISTSCSLGQPDRVMWRLGR